jgi:hypothetical protein
VTRTVLCVLGILCGLGAVISAQMDPALLKQASGIPRPVDDLPDGTISIRVVRGDLSRPIQNQSVELRVGDDVKRVDTDGEGRAEFLVLTSGTVKAVTVVDGARLESQEFRAPGRGGIRMVLVATDKEAAARAAEGVKAAITGPLVIGSETQIVVEPDDEIVRVYYLLEIMNPATVHVNPPELFMFDVPSSAIGASIMEGSQGDANVNGTRVRVQGPFPPGRTAVQVAYALDSGSGSIEISQTFPVTLEHLAVIVKKIGDAALSSPQIARQQEMPVSGEVFIAATGEGAIAAGQPIALSITGLPHHSRAPRWIAMSIAAAIAFIGVLAARRPEEAETRGAERKRLIARREKLFQDLVRLEHDHRRGRLDGARYTSRREELLGALEHVYGALESDDPGVAA